MANKVVKAIKDKVAYEKESWRMSQEYLRQVNREIDAAKKGKR